MISALLTKPRPFKNQQRSMANGISLTTNRTNFHESGEASPENFIGGVIRVCSGNSWFKCSSLWHPCRTGSFASQRIGMSEIVVVEVYEPRVG